MHSACYCSLYVFIRHSIVILIDLLNLFHSIRYNFSSVMIGANLYRLNTHVHVNGPKARTRVRINSFKEIIATYSTNWSIAVARTRIVCRPAKESRLSMRRESQRAKHVFRPKLSRCTRWVPLGLIWSRNISFEWRYSILFFPFRQWRGGGLQGRDLSSARRGEIGRSTSVQGVDDVSAVLAQRHPRAQSRHRGRRLQTRRRDRRCQRGGSLIFGHARSVRTSKL